MAFKKSDGIVFIWLKISLIVSKLGASFKQIGNSLRLFDDKSIVCNWENTLKSRGTLLID